MLTLMSLSAVCLLVTVVLWGWFRWTHRRLIRVASKLPGMLPNRFPVLGHIPYTFFGMEKTTNWCIAWLTESVNRGDKNFCLWLGPFPIIAICELEDIQKVLTSSSTSEKGDEMKYMDYALGQGLLNCPGNMWKIKRRYLNPMFHPQNVEQMMPTFNRNSEELVINLSKHISRGPVNVLEYTMDTALQTICHQIFGPDIEFEMSSKGFKGLKSIVERIPDIFVKRVILIWLRINAIFEFLYKKEISEMKKLWQGFTDPPFKIAKKRTEEKLALRNPPSASGGKEFAYAKSEGLLNLLDVHSALQQNFPQFTEEDLKSEMMTLYTTGTDTIGGILSSCLLALGHYQEVQDRLYKEITTFVNPDKDVTLEDLQNLPYLDQVFKETLRWSVIVPFIIRKTTEDIKLSFGTVPAGYTIGVGIGVSHLDPKLYPDPLTFNPERFSPINVVSRERYAFLPFSGGPRSCIGKTYATLLTKVMIVHILRRYKVSTSVNNIHNMRKKLVITLINVEGYNVTLENR